MDRPTPAGQQNVPPPPPPTGSRPPGAPDLSGWHPVKSVGIPPDHDVLILGVNIGMTALALVIVIMRTLVRMKIVKAVGWDDYFTMLATAFTIVMAVFQCIEVHYGMGMHLGDLTPEFLVIIEKYHYLSMILYSWCLGLAKIGRLCFLLRLSERKNQKGIFSYTVYGFMAFVAALTVSSTIVLILQCIPPKSIYDHSIWPETCIDKFLFLVSIGAINIGTDVGMVLLPVPLFWQLQISVRQRLVLIGIFALGGFVCVASVCRLTTLLAITRSGDLTWAMAPFSATEASLAIICASLPPLKPFVSRYFPKLVSPSSWTWSFSGGRSLPYGSTTITSVSGGRRRSVLQNSYGRKPEDNSYWTDNMDTGSEEMILESMRAKEAGIVKTTDIRVTENGLPGPTGRQQGPGEFV